MVGFLTRPRIALCILRFARDDDVRMTVDRNSSAEQSWLPRRVTSLFACNHTCRYAKLSNTRETS